MKKRYILFVLFHVSLFQIYSQDKNIEDFEAKMDAYFNLDYETFYTHTNKTTYFTNEEIWFKTYVYNTKTQLPFISTTNIYTSLYDENGNLIKKKMYAGLDGMASGNIKIDSTFKTGTYYLKTDSNWSKNFSLDNTFIQKIKIINAPEDIIKKDKATISYDFQLLPEGGHLVEETTNTVGFKLINSLGHSEEIASGKIIDNNNNLIVVFKSNGFGLGKFMFKPEKNKQYTCLITLQDGQTITKTISDIEIKGVNLQVDANRTENVVIHINTNSNTIKELANKSYYAIIHRDGLIKKIEIPFTKKQLNYSFNIKKTLLHPGVNIITLINEKQEPIAERVIFNTISSNMKPVKVKQVIKGKDSSVIKLKTINSNSNLSVSVLPAKTKANNNNSSIVSSFLIDPYIKGTLENPRYYFKDIDREKIYNLDLLLLTQGWSKYSWNSIFNYSPKVTHNFETGVEIKGNINNYKYKSGDKILLQSKQNGILEESTVSETGNFSFNNLFLIENSSISFSLKDKKGKQTKPNIYYNIFPKNINSTIKVSNNNNKNVFIIDDNFKDFAYNKEINVLDEVEVKGVYKKPEPINTVLNAWQARHITFEDGTNQSSLITDQLYTYFDVTNNGIDVTIKSRRPSRNPIPRVFLDHIEITNDLDIISHLRVNDVEEMFVSTSASNLYKSIGVIHIFTKRGKSKPTKATYRDSEISFGFSIPKEYYSPIYNKMDYENFNNYGVLNWIPNVIKDEKGELSFKIPNHYYDDINLYIEGMSADGSLYSTTETISINKKKAN